jgi:hypothetical protein
MASFIKKNKAKEDKNKKGEMSGNDHSGERV